MNPGYFEKAHRDERRRSEWKMLDDALLQRTDSAFHEGLGLRRALGRLLIQAGSKLIREQSTRN